VTVISRRHSLLFLKSMKTAGTSLELAFIGNRALAADIWNTSSDIRRHGLPKHRRSLVLAAGRRRLFVDSGLVRRWLGARKGRPWFSVNRIEQHHPAAELKRVLGESIWNGLIKVTSVRNPWDLVASHYRWRASGAGGRLAPLTLSFGDFVQNMYGAPDAGEDSGFLSSRRTLLPYLMIDDEIIVDQVIRVEDIAGSLRVLSNRIGCRLTTDIGHEKRTSRGESWRSYYTPELRDMVYEMFQPVIERYDYEY
jgi:hypothetical protein